MPVKIPSFDEFQRLSGLLADDPTDDGVERILIPSAAFTEEAAKYDMTPQQLFDYLMEAKQ